MGLRDVIKDLAVKKRMSVAELERTLGFGNGSISKWNKQSPSVDKLNKVANYFDVSIDYLLGRPSKHEAPKELELSANAPLLWEGMPFSDADQELLKNIAARLANK